MDWSCRATSPELSGEGEAAITAESRGAGQGQILEMMGAAETPSARTL